MKIMVLCMPLFISGQILYAQKANAILGKWYNTDGNKQMQLEIYLAQDGKYYGKVINDNSVPTNNGTIVLKALQYDAATASYKGTMQPPDFKKEIPVATTLQSSNQLTIVVKKLFVSKTFYLQRIQ